MGKKEEGGSHVCGAGVMKREETDHIQHRLIRGREGGSSHRDHIFRGIKCIEEESWISPYEHELSKLSRIVVMNNWITTDLLNKQPALFQSNWETVILRKPEYSTCYQRMIFTVTVAEDVCPEAWKTAGISEQKHTGGAAHSHTHTQLLYLAHNKHARSRRRVRIDTLWWRRQAAIRLPHIRTLTGLWIIQRLHWDNGDSCACVCVHLFMHQCLRRGWVPDREGGKITQPFHVCSLHLSFFHVSARFM